MDLLTSNTLSAAEDPTGLSTRLDTEDSAVEPQDDARGASPYSLNAAVAAFRHSGWTKRRNEVWTAFVRMQRLRFLGASSSGHEDGAFSSVLPVSRSRLQAFERCGQDAFVLESVTEPGRYRVTSNKCHDRFCVPCMNERAYANKAKLLAKLKGVVHRFVTLTLRTENEPLTAQLNRLYGSFRKLRQRAFWKRHVKGGIAFIEVKWSPSANRWHPHLHVLTHGRFMPKKDLGRQWYAVTGDSYIVDIRKVDDDDKAAEYVGKYASKGYDHKSLADPARLHEAIAAFHGRRFVIVFGDWKGFRLTDAEDEQGWRIVDSLASVLAQVRLGDPNACRILAALRPKIDEELQQHLEVDARGRPPPRTYTEQQASLWGDASPHAPRKMAYEYAAW